MIFSGTNFLQTLFIQGPVSSIVVDIWQTIVGMLVKCWSNVRGHLSTTFMCFINLKCWKRQLSPTFHVTSSLIGQLYHMIFQMSSTTLHSSNIPKRHFSWFYHPFSTTPCKLSDEGLVPNMNDMVRSDFSVLLLITFQVKLITSYSV